MGNHILRAGLDVVRRRVRVTNFIFGFPSITVASPASRNPADILNQTFISFGIGNQNGKRIPGTPDNAHSNTRLSWYTEDTWRVRPNFTLSYGVRYEADTHPLNNDLNKPNLVGPILPRGTQPTPIDKNNLAPHAGLAWDPWNNGKTSIRVGGGIYYALRISNQVTNERASIAPFNSGNDTIIFTAGSASGRRRPARDRPRHAVSPHGHSFRQRRSDAARASPDQPRPPLVRRAAAPVPRRRRPSAARTCCSARPRFRRRPTPHRAARSSR